MLVTLHPNYIKEGNDELVSLPASEYKKVTELLEDYEDLMELRAAKAKYGDEETYSLDEVKDMLDL